MHTDTPPTTQPESLDGLRFRHAVALTDERIARRVLRKAEADMLEARRARIRTARALKAAQS